MDVQFYEVANSTIRINYQITLSLLPSGLLIAQKSPKSFNNPFKVARNAPSRNPPSPPSPTILTPFWSTLYHSPILNITFPLFYHSSHNQSSVSYLCVIIIIMIIVLQCNSK